MKHRIHEVAGTGRLTKVPVTRCVITSKDLIRPLIKYIPIQQSPHSGWLRLRSQVTHPQLELVSFTAVKLYFANVALIHTQHLITKLQQFDSNSTFTSLIMIVYKTNNDTIQSKSLSFMLVLKYR